VIFSVEHPIHRPEEQKTRSDDNDPREIGCGPNGILLWKETDDGSNAEEEQSGDHERDGVDAQTELIRGLKPSGDQAKDQWDDI